MESPENVQILPMERTNVECPHCDGYDEFKIDREIKTFEGRRGIEIACAKCHNRSMLYLEGE